MNRTVYLIHPDHGETVVFDEHQFRYLTEQRGWKVKPVPEPVVVKPEPVKPVPAVEPMKPEPKADLAAPIEVKVKAVEVVRPRRGRPPKKG